ncbi:MAG: hypothetical protein WCY84_00690 [Candidatus Cloacimonadaceae bacterium]
MRIKHLSLLLLVVMLAGQLAALPKAPELLLSLALPGYSQIKSERNLGYVLLGAEAALIGSVYYFNSEEQLLKEASYSYALKYADLQPGEYDNAFYKNMGRYNSSGYDANGYNAAVREKALTLFPYDPESQQEYIEQYGYNEEQAWYWQSQSHKSRYNKYRNDALDMKSYSKLAGGVLLLNHVINVIDYAIGRKHQATQLSVQLKGSTPRLVLSHSF